MDYILYLFFIYNSITSTLTYFYILYLSYDIYIHIILIILWILQDIIAIIIDKLKYEYNLHLFLYV